MDIETLRTFLVLAESKNFTRTAAELYIAQSTVTNRILELERELNVSLFQRTNKTVDLTLEGKIFKDYASHIIEITDSTLPKITSLQVFDNNLRIGCSDSIYESNLAFILKEYKKTHPKDSISITIGMSNQLIEQIKNNEFDVVFCYLPAKNRSLNCEVYLQDDIILVTDYANKKYKNGITKSDLQREDYLLCHYALQDIGLFIKGLFPKYHQFSLEIDDCAKVVPFLMNQNNYTFLPRTVAQPYIRNKILRDIPLLDINAPIIKIYVICQKSKIDLCQKIFGLNRI